MPVLPVSLPHEFSRLMPLSSFSYVPALEVSMEYKKEAKSFQISLISKLQLGGTGTALNLCKRKQ